MSALALSAHRFAPAASPLCIAAGAVALALGRDALAASDHFAALTVTLAGYALLLVLAVAAARLADLDWSDLGLGARRLLPRLIGGLAMGGALALPATVHGISIGLLPAALPAALTASVVEELLFRGVVFALLARTLHPAFAIAVSSVAFAAAHAAHYPPPILLLGLAVGLLLGIWRWLANDLVGATVAHTIADLAAALAVA